MMIYNTSYKQDVSILQVNMIHLKGVSNFGIQTRLLEDSNLFIKYLMRYGPVTRSQVVSTWHRGYSERIHTLILLVVVKDSTHIIKWFIDVVLCIHFSPKFILKVLEEIIKFTFPEIVRTHTLFIILFPTEFWVFRRLVFF